MFYSAVMGYTTLSEKDSAFAVLEKAFRDRDDSILTIKVEPYFDNIHSDAR
jgi:hypothetical protein